MSEQTESKFSNLTFGFNLLDQRTANGLQVIKDISDYMKKRAQLEADYSKKLTDLYKEKPGAGFFNSVPVITKEPTVLKTALLGIEEKGLKVAEKHLEFSTKIQSEICTPLDSLYKAKDPERKKISIEGQKYLRNLGEARTNVNRLKQAFDAAMKEAEVAQEQFEKAEKDEINQPENKKLKPLTQKASANFEQKKTKAKNASASYDDSIKKANDELEKFCKESMPNVLNQLQKWEEERWNNLLNVIKTLSSLQELVPAAISEYVNDLKDIVTNSVLETDIKETVEQVSKEAKEESPLVFTPYSGKFSLEEKPEEEKPEEEKPEEEKKADFSTLTAQEKLELAKKEETSSPQMDPQQQAELKKKTDELKANLFSSDQDLFKD